MIITHPLIRCSWRILPLLLCTLVAFLVCIDAYANSPFRSHQYQRLRQPPLAPDSAKSIPFHRFHRGRKDCTTLFEKEIGDTVIQRKDYHAAKVVTRDEANFARRLPSALAMLVWNCVRSVLSTLVALASFPMHRRRKRKETGTVVIRYEREVKNESTDDINKYIDDEKLKTHNNSKAADTKNLPTETEENDRKIAEEKAREERIENVRKWVLSTLEKNEAETRRLEEEKRRQAEEQHRTQLWMENAMRAINRPD